MHVTPPAGFDALIRDYLDAAFRLDPLAATDAGIHDHDGAWPDLSESGRQVAVDALDAWQARLAALDDGALTFDQRGYGERPPWRRPSGRPPSRAPTRLSWCVTFQG